MSTLSDDRPAALRPLVFEDLERNRLTVAFRLILALPHLVWLALFSSVAVLVLPIHWIVTLVRGTPSRGLHGLYATLVRLAVHVYAYVALAGNRYPGFLADRPYTVDVEIPPPARQNRWTVAFRLILGLPPLALAAAFVGGGPGGSSTDTTAGDATTNVALNLGVVAAVALVAWFACLARGRLSPGLRDVLVLAITYAAQVYAYLFLVTGRYPNSDPTLVPRSAPPPHPVRLTVDDDLRRSRLTVGFRLLLAFPHLVWIALWAAVVLVSAPFVWLASIVVGRLPAPLHRFYARFIRYGAHLSAFIYVAGNPFPGFTGLPGSYPIDVSLPAPGARQARWRIALRWLLALPALIIASALGTVATLSGIGGWFASLFTARMPLGLRNLVAYTTRYSAQVYAFALLVTDRYPNSATAEPVAEPAAAPEPSPFGEPQSAVQPGLA